MNSRHLGTILLSCVYRTGKRNFKTAVTCASPASLMEPQTSELKIADSSKDPPRQENVAEHSFTSSTVNFDASQQVENVVDDAASASEEGTSLSKRALKRVKCLFIYCISLCKKLTTLHDCRSSH